MAFYDTKTVAAKLGISIFTLRKYLQLGWLKAGKLPGGTVWRFSEAQLKQAMICFEEGGNCENKATNLECGIGA